jgi:hypothetical protein
VNKRIRPPFTLLAILCWVCVSGRLASAQAPDTTPPTVTVTSPAPGSTVAADFRVTADASDNVGVVGVRFYLDGNPLGSEDTRPSYRVTWDTTTANDGIHTLTAVARDAAGNRTTSVSVSVIVANDTSPPTVVLTAPAAGSRVSGTFTVAASASDNVEVLGVQFHLDGSPLGAEDTGASYRVSWDTTTTSNGMHTLTAVARDAAGNRTTSASVTVAVDNDISPPTVTLTAPAAASTIAGTVTLSASASDNVGVAGVQFQLDGNPLGAEDTTTPYSLAWNTATTPDGVYTLTAVARDAVAIATAPLRSPSPSQTTPGRQPSPRASCRVRQCRPTRGNGDGCARQASTRSSTWMTRCSMWGNTGLRVSSGYRWVLGPSRRTRRPNDS